jgi:hypothetical protein
MDRSSLIVVLMPITTLIVLFTGITLPFIAGSRSGRSHAGRPLARSDALKRIGAARRKAPRPDPDADNAARAGYLYVLCVHNPHNGYPAGTRRWVQEVPIVKKTAKLIYYTSDSWDRREAVVGPGCISREQFETDTRCHDGHGYPAGVIPIPGDRHPPGTACRLFFATRQAAEDHLYRGERGRAGRAAPQGPSIKELRRAMANAHPDRGGMAEQFIQARRQYQTALRSARP